MSITAILLQIICTAMSAIVLRKILLVIQKLTDSQYQETPIAGRVVCYLLWLPHCLIQWCLMFPLLVFLKETF